MHRCTAPRFGGFSFLTLKQAGGYTATITLGRRPGHHSGCQTVVWCGFPLIAQPPHRKDRTMPDSAKPTPETLPAIDYSGGKRPAPPEAGIGERIKELRTGLGISVETLSALTAKFDFDAPSESAKGVSVPSLYRYEKGERFPGAREIRLLCDALRTTPNWLVIGGKADAMTSADTEIANLARRLFSLIGDSLEHQNNGWTDIEHSLKLSEAKIEAKDPTRIVQTTKVRTD